MALRSRVRFRRRRAQYEPDYGAMKEIVREVASQPDRGRREVIQPATPSAYGPQLGAWVRLPGANFPPGGARVKDVMGAENIAPGAIATRLVTITVPSQSRLHLAGIGFHTDDDVALGFLTWAIVTVPGNDPVGDYGQMQAAVGSIRQLSRIEAEIGASLTVNVIATISATAPITYLYACRLFGWFYAEKESG
jgi:hypothetical protein